MAGASALELVTGYRGKAHVTADDARSYNAGTVGDGVYALGGGLAATMVDANTLRVSSGTILAQGCQCRVRSGEYAEVKIRNGSQSMKRNDIVVARFERQSAEPRTESVTLKVIEGTPSGDAASDPAHVSGDILAGDLVAEWPLWRVPLDGISVGDPVPLFARLETLDSLQDARPATDVLYNSGGWTISERAGIVFVSAWNIKTDSGSWATTKCPFVIPAGKRPVEHVAAAAVTQNNGSVAGVLVVEQNGEASVRNYGGTGTTNGRYASLSYAVAQK